MGRMSPRYGAATYGGILTAIGWGVLATGLVWMGTSQRIRGSAIPSGAISGSRVAHRVCPAITRMAMTVVVLLVPSDQAVNATYPQSSPPGAPSSPCSGNACLRLLIRTLVVLRFFTPTPRVLQLCAKALSPEGQLLQPVRGHHVTSRS